jgi:CRISPR-associated protein Cas2
MRRKTTPWKAARPGLALTRGEPEPQHTMVIYDVPEDKARRRLGELCKDYGLHRFQWSAFEGELSRNHREELYDRGRGVLAAAEGGGKLLVVAVGARERANELRAAERGRPKRSEEAG